MENNGIDTDNYQVTLKEPYSFKNQPSILTYLENLIKNQIIFQHKNSSDGNDIDLKESYYQNLQHLKQQLRRKSKARWDNCLQSETYQQYDNKIQLIINKLLKYKQINIYFTNMHKNTFQFQSQITKFLSYTQKQVNIKLKIQQYLSDTTVSQLLIKNYQNSFNPNNFTADLIDFNYFLDKNNILEIPQSQQYVAIRNQDLQLIQHSQLIFRQICEISDKYMMIQYSLRNSYINFSFVQDTHKQQNSSLQQLKMMNVDLKKDQMDKLAQKIKLYYGKKKNTFNQEQIIVLPQQKYIFQETSNKFSYLTASKNTKIFQFLQGVCNNKQTQVQQDNKKQSYNFTFLRYKIIKAELRWHLNKILSSFNIFSFLINQLADDISPEPISYFLKNPGQLINVQFDENKLKFYENVDIRQMQKLQLLNKPIEYHSKSEQIQIKIQKNKIIYPSSIYNYYYYLKYLLCSGEILQKHQIYNDQLLLQIVSIKAVQLNQWAQLFLDIYQIIKNKYYNCYSILKKYIQLIYKQQYLQQLDHIQKIAQSKQKNISSIFKNIIMKQKKAGYISQIIFQLDPNYNIYEPLLKFYQIQQSHYHTFYSWDHQYYYQTVLNQIIQTKNNLILNKIYSINSLNHTFGFINTRPSNLSNLAQQLAPICQQKFKLSQLLRFYRAQSKLKRQIFKAEHYWTTIISSQIKNKYIIHANKNKINFNTFLQLYANQIISIKQNNLQFFIQNIVQFQRHVDYFIQQVERMKYMQAILILLKPQFPLQNYLSGFQSKQLKSFFEYCSQFNYVQDIYIRKDKKNWILSKIQKIISQTGKCKFVDISQDLNAINLKLKFSGILFTIYSFGHHIKIQDCINLKKLIINKGLSAEDLLSTQILRSKRQINRQYQQCQSMNFESIVQLYNIYDHLIHITINRLIYKKLVQNQDKKILMLIRSLLLSNNSFKQFEQLLKRQKIYKQARMFSKSSFIVGIYNILVDYKQKKKISTSQNTIQMIFMISKLSLVSRRLFCNELIQLKNQINGDQWKFFNKQDVSMKLVKILNLQLLNKIQNYSKQYIQFQQSLSNLSIQKCLNKLKQMLKKQIIKDYDSKFIIPILKKKQIKLFDQINGYMIQSQQNLKQHLILNLNQPFNNKQRNIINRAKDDNNKYDIIIAKLMHKVDLEILKQTLPIRKLIYRLQLQQKRVRDQIEWQTCKLQNKVITKINQFIQQSTQDQILSLRQFKFSVGQATIRGLQNLINQKKQVFKKLSQAKLNNTSQQGFLTQPQAKQKISYQNSLLDINVKNVFNHVKKLKIFWAWKNMKKYDENEGSQWQKFSKNAQKILHNSQNIMKLKNIEQLRNKCTRQQIQCNLLKQQNEMISNKIKDMKINTLTDKLNLFKNKHNIQ